MHTAFGKTIIFMMLFPEPSRYAIALLCQLLLVSVCQLIIIPACAAPSEGTQ